MEQSALQGPQGVNGGAKDSMKIHQAGSDEDHQLKNLLYQNHMEDVIW